MALNEWMQRGDTAGVPAAKSGLGVRSGFQVTFFSMSSLYLVPLMAAVTWLVKYRLYRRQPRKIYIRNPFPQNRRGRIIVHSKYLLCLDILFFSTSIQSNSKCQPSRQQSCQPSRPPRSTPASAWWCGGWRIMHPRLAPWLSVPSQPSSSPSLPSTSTSSTTSSLWWTNAARVNWCHLPTEHRTYEPRFNNKTKVMKICLI